MIEKLKNATGYAFAGLKHAFQTERAFRQECWVCLVLVPLSFVIGNTPLERIALIAPLFLVLIIELLNTGIEKTLDFISTERHPLIKAAKDMSSAAVFLSILLTLIVWGTVLSAAFFGF